MRKHIAALTAVLAAAFLFGGTAFAASASAATSAPAALPVIGTTAQGGYQASNRDFRFIEGTLTVPDISYFTGFFPTEYLQLSNGTQLSTTPILGSGDQYVRAGIVPCVIADNFGANCSGWTAFVTTFSNGLGGGTPVHFFPLSVNAGDGVNFSVFYDQGGQDLHFVITPPNANGSTGPVTYEESAPGAIFDHAGVLDDFTDSYGGAPAALPPFVHAFRINQFLNVALTTYSGAKGSLAGPWTTSQVIATSNGVLPPAGTTRVSPNALWSDGASANGAVRADDAVGVWAR